VLLRYRSSVRKTGLTTLTFNLLIKVLSYYAFKVSDFGRLSRCFCFGNVFDVMVIINF
jgi:hypothetical protein